MSDIIFKLRLEHRNIANVLDLLDDQVQRLEGGAAPNPGLVARAIEYLQGFPEECHHPKEDLVFRMLRDKAPERAADLFDLNVEHQQLAALTGRVAAEVANGPLTADHGTLLRQYVDSYREHLSGEEREFLPAALNNLSRDDFALLDYEIFDRSDHLFDDAAETRFDDLKHRINELARLVPAEPQDFTGRPAIDELSLLRSVDSVQHFNDRMGGHRLELVPYHGGGYSLRLNGQWLVDIPDCDEERAAWCAFFYWKALGAGSVRKQD